MRVFWTNTAVQHLLSIYAYIAQDAPRYGQRMVERLTERSEQVAAFPLSGRMVPEYEAPDVREVIERPYRIILSNQAGSDRHLGRGTQCAHAATGTMSQLATGAIRRWKATVTPLEANYAPGSERILDAVDTARRYQVTRTARRQLNLPPHCLTDLVTVAAASPLAADWRR